MTENPYEKFNEKLKKDAEEIFRSTDIDESDVRELKQAMNTARMVLTKVEPNETTDFLQSFISFILRICG